ncbi:hypothetical protein MtrunA17_Chr3g0139591 [Medicago truncatula]|uniref:Uncharacterized protein n=1 Tax=Medicago truncatula TaxID=3880 RepID=A0A396J313_MEDTR|nr:hypothetical protein MtrunA17_Chr3g0139591 [Medicago truncatula]
MTGVQEDRISPFSADEKEQVCRGISSKKKSVVEWICLQPLKDESIRFISDIKFSLTLLCSRHCLLCVLMNQFPLRLPLIYPLIKLRLPCVLNRGLIMHQWKQLAN